MKRKLLVLTSLVMALALVSASSLAMNRLNRLNRRRIEDQLKTTSLILSNYKLDDFAGQEIEQIGQSLHEFDNQNLRLTAIDYSGKVLYDSQVNSSELDNHLFRSEVQGIIKGEGPLITIRHSSSLDQDFMYYALPNRDQDCIIRTSLPLAVERSDIFSYRREILGLSLLTGLVLFLIAKISLNSITRPLDQLVVANQKFASGKLEQRVTETGPPGIASLLHSFNAMAAQIEFAHLELSQQEAWLNALINALPEPLLVVDKGLNLLYANLAAQSIFGRELDPGQTSYPVNILTNSPVLDDILRELFAGKTMLRNELSLATVSGERPYGVVASLISDDNAVVLFNDINQEVEARRMRSEFVANVSHELKTPLTSIKGFIETLNEQPDLSSERRQAFLQIIEHEAGRLERLINELLDLARIEHGAGFNDQEEKFNLADLFAQLIEELGEKARKAQVELVAEYQDSTLMVQASRDRFKQVLLNLIDNGIKYNHPGGKVYLNFKALPAGKAGFKRTVNQSVNKEKASQDLAITIKDTGIGFTENEQKRVFERFYRTAGGREHSPDGTGLGLAIVKHLCLNYGGDIECKSKLGEGTEFILIFPNSLIGNSA